MKFDILKEKLCSTLDPKVSTSQKIQSAILCIIYDSANPSIIMTLKPKNMRHHAGEISFPGGKFEKEIDSDLVDTALRETQEELGVTIMRSDVIGQLDMVNTQSSGYEITPFVYITDRLTTITPNEEIDEVLYLPLDDLFASAQTSSSQGLVFIYQKYNIWGASARILGDIGRRTGLLSIDNVDM